MVNLNHDETMHWGCAAVILRLNRDIFIAITFLLLSLTPLRAQSPAKFAVIGDYGWAGQGEQDVANLVKSWNPDFIITTGDNNYNSGSASTIDSNIGQYFHSFIYPYKGSYGAGATTNRFFPAIGNHDWGNESGGCAPTTNNAQPYLSYFTLPNNGRYYDFVWGPVHFFMMDSDCNEPNGTSSTSVQAQWLKQKLAAATEPWKVVVIHHPAYTSAGFGDTAASGSFAYMQWPFQAWGASVVLQGHIHVYERLLVNGLTYFVNGIGGRSFDNYNAVNLSGSQVRYNDDFGAQLVTADTNRINFQLYNRYGKLIDRYTICSGCSPDAPVGLAALGGNGRVDLSWAPGVSGSLTYNVRRSNTSGGGYQTIASGITKTTYTDLSVSNGTTYYYVITATNSSGTSPNSNEDSGFPTSTVRIKDPGPNFTASDGSVYFAAEQPYFSGGHPVWYSPRSIAKTSNPRLYLSARRGNPFSYTIPANNGSYTLKLHFAECQYSASGQRRFNVSVNGSPVLTNFDIYAVAGANTAYVASIPVNVTSNSVFVQFTRASGADAVVAAVELVPNSSTSPTPDEAEPLRFVPMAPCRVVDTRWGPGPFGGPIMAGQSTRDFEIPIGPCTGIPANARAYSLNVSVIPETILSYLSIWPAGQERPFVSTLNSFDGRVKADAAIVRAGTNGAVSVFVTDASHVFMDIDGYFVPEGSVADSLAFYPVTPCRVLDTRLPAGPFGGPAIAVGQQRDIPVQASPCSIPAAAQAYSLNFTVVPQGRFDYLTTWPAGLSRPEVSTLNAFTGAVTANAAIVPAGIGGAISIFATQTADVVIDINGYFAPPDTGGLSFYATAPCRVVDTRWTGVPDFGSPSLTGSRAYALPGQCGLPSAAAYSLNATVVPQEPLGYLTLWPEGVQMPVVSTLNSHDGTVVSNAAIVPATEGSINVFATQTTDLFLDVNGYFAP